MESDQCDDDDSVNRSLFSEMDATDPQQITDSPSSTAAVVAGCEPSEARTEGDTSDAISGPPPHDASVPQGAAAGNENVVDQRLRRRKIAPAASALESADGPSKGSGGLIDLTDSPDAYKPAAKRHSGNDNTRIIIPDTPENGKASSFAQPPEQDTSKVVRLGDSPASNVAVVGKSIEISSDDEDIFSPQKQTRAQDKESAGGGCAPRNIVSHPPPPPPPPAPAAIVKRATPSDEEDSDSICDMTHGAPDNGSSFSKREGKQVASDRNDGVDKTQFARELFKEWYPLLEEAPLLRTDQLQLKLSQYAFQQGKFKINCRKYQKDKTGPWYMRVSCAGCSTVHPDQRGFQINLVSKDGQTGWTVNMPKQGKGTHLLHSDGSSHGTECGRWNPDRQKASNVAQKMIHEIPTAPLFNAGAGAARANKVDMIQSVTGEHVSEQKAHDVWKLMQQKYGGNVPEEEWQKVDSLMQYIEEKMPGSACEVEWEVQEHDDGSVTKHFKRCFVQLGKTVEYLIATGIQVLQVDGAFMSTGAMHGWRKLAAVVKTGEGYVLPVCLQICASESEDQFTTMCCKMCSLGLNVVLRERDASQGRLGVIRDGAVTIQNSASSSFTSYHPQSGFIDHVPLQIECQDHFVGRLKQKFPAKWPTARPHFYQAKNAETKPEFDACMKILLEEAGQSIFDYIDSHDHESWALYAMLQQDAMTCGIQASQSGESWNSVTQPDRAAGSAFKIIQTHADYSDKTWHRIYNEADRKINHLQGSRGYISDAAIAHLQLMEERGKFLKVEHVRSHQVFRVTPLQTPHDAKRQYAALLAGKNAGEIDAGWLLKHTPQYTAKASADSIALDHPYSEVFAAQMEQVVVDLNDLTRLPKCRHMGLPDENVMAVFRFLREKCGQRDDALYNMYSLPFAEEWCHERYWCSMALTVFQRAPGAVIWSKPSLHKLIADKACFPPLTSTRRAVDVLSKVDRISKQGEHWWLHSQVDPASIETEMLEAIDDTGAPPFVPDARHNDHDRRRALERHVRAVVDVVDHSRGGRYRTKRMQAGDDRAKNTRKYMLFRYELQQRLASKHCSLCDGASDHRSDKHISDISNPAIAALLGVFNQKHRTHFQLEDLPRDRGSGSYYWPTRRQLVGMNAADRIVQLRITWPDTNVAMKLLPPKVTGRDAAAALGRLEQAYGTPQKEGAVTGSRSQDDPEGAAAAAPRMSAPVRSAAPASPSARAVGPDQVPASIKSMFEPYLAKQGLSPQNPETLGSRKGLVTAKGPFTPGPWAPVSGTLVFDLLEKLKHGSAQEKQFLANYPGRQWEFGHGKDFNFRNLSINDMAVKFLWIFCPEPPPGSPRELPNHIWYNKQGISTALEQMELRVTSAGLLPIFELRRLIFGEPRRNGADKYMQEANKSKSASDNNPAPRSKRGGAGVGRAQSRPVQAVPVPPPQMQAYAQPPMQMPPMQMFAGPHMLVPPHMHMVPPQHMFSAAPQQMHVYAGPQMFGQVQPNVMSASGPNMMAASGPMHWATSWETISDRANQQMEQQQAHTGAGGGGAGGGAGV